ncbi:MAG: DUF4129 domain-containing protein [Acidimicrobiia bacterium]
MAGEPTIRPRVPWWVVALLALSIIALAGLIALGAREVPGTGTSRGLAADLGWDPRLVFTWLIATLFGLAAYTALTTERGRMERRGRGRRRSSPIAVFLVLAVLAIVMLLAGGNDTAGGERLVPSLPGEGSLAESPPAQAAGTPWGLVTVAVVMAAALIVFFALGRRAAFELHPRLDAAEVAASVDAAIEELELGGDPSQVVIAAYRNMEAALERGGLHRAGYEAPHEYVARALGLLSVEEEAIRRLTQLFEEARFSTHTIDDVMAAEAVEALRSIRIGLTTS